MQDKNINFSIRNITKDEIDENVKKFGFNDRSPFIEYCISRVIYKNKSTRRNLIVLWIGVYLILALILIILILTR